ncbi:MAG: hypothetical protein C0408_08145 [Odoribacter sp.]|nr:hypothetical protein [Odoribacter sp.]
MLMKNYLYLGRLSAAVILTILLTQSGNCQTLLIENFSYTPGSSLTSNGWNSHSSAGINPVVVSSQGLVFPGYPSSDIGLSALMANTGEDVNKAFTTVTTGSIFCAFLVQLNAIENDYFLHLSGIPVGNNYKGRIFTSGTGSTYNFGLSKGSGTTSYTTGSPFTTATVYLLVLKYSITEGASNDEVSLYIISGAVPATEPLTASIGPLADAGQTDLTNVSAVALRQYSSAQNILVDGIRVATKWEDAVSALTISKDLSQSDYPVLYPVPVKEELFVSNARNITMIAIFDLSGRKVISVKTENNDIAKIRVDHLSKGLYLIRLNTSAGIKIMKFIKS